MEVSYIQKSKYKFKPMRNGFLIKSIIMNMILCS